ncbi:hypothetical protein K7W42_00880 [Deinococcus sp. HMF7604]|uniref:hypothetical protein n=1 Tax=Deinococcus betulae TaxID=2873312 RepID=UPI001CCEA882|nr:hypothetical protein [Deinococcus betulae]MBZ9749406.1 hypothetical protein [Deinococcus betulae]
MRHHLLITAVFPLLLAACGGGGTGTPTPNPIPTPNPNPNPGSAVTTRLATCPVVSNSSDPAASACLAGTYAGKTLSGADCSLTVRADGSYDYASPTLSYTSAPTAQSIRVFSHSDPQNTHQVIWLISDPMSANEPKELDFEARWGAYIQSPKLEIEATKHLAGGGRVSSACTLTL